MNVSLANKLMVDVASHLGEGVMVKDDCIEHEDLCYEQLSKSTTFEPPPRRGPTLVTYFVRNLITRLDSVRRAAPWPS
jgi:hypothetical protein